MLSSSLPIYLSFSGMGRWQKKFWEEGGVDNYVRNHFPIPLPVLRGGKRMGRGKEDSPMDEPQGCLSELNFKQYFEFHLLKKLKVSNGL